MEGLPKVGSSVLGVPMILGVVYWGLDRVL